MLLAVVTCFAPGSVAQAEPHECGHDDDSGLEVIATFDASRFETPESLVIDSRNNMVVSLGLTGEIRKIAPNGAQSTLAVLPLGAPPLTSCGPLVGIMGALAIDHHDNVYATLNSCDPTKRGIWRISPAGQTRQLASLPMSALPDGIVFRRGQLYVADAELGLIWRVDADGGRPPQVWADGPLLKPHPGHMFPGPNGVQFFDDELYVSNSDQGTILAIPVRHDDTAGPARIHAEGIPCDDFAFDVFGDIYCTTEPFNTVVRIFPDGTQEVLLTAADGLDGPSATVFGRHGEDRFDLYITNGAFPMFSTTHQPSLMRLDLDIPGAPRP